MRCPVPSRLLASAALCGILLCSLCVPAAAAARRGQGTPQTGRQSAYPSARGQAPQHPQPGARPGQEHLAQWMSHHDNLQPSDQQRALEREPGFRDLSPQVQQRMHDRLTQLNNMPPQKRQRVLDRAEVMEHLAPEQRQRVRGTMQQLSNLPEDRRRVVSRAFRELRSLPPDQRRAALASSRYTADLSPQERSTLNNLNDVEPLLPPPPPPRLPPQGSTLR